MNNSPKTVGFKPGERNIFFHILTACNLSCRHCYINKAQHGTAAVDQRADGAVDGLVCRPQEAIEYDFFRWRADPASGSALCH